MRVAHCIHGLGSGGAQKIIAAIVSGCQTADLSYFVYSCHDGVQRREIEVGGATVRLVPRSLEKFDPLWVGRLARTMRSDCVDLVHTHLFGDSLHGLLAARLAGGLPVVMTLHTRPEGLTPVQRWGYRWLLRRCAGAVACSRAVSRDFAAGRFPTDRLETIANGVAPSEAQPLEAKQLAALRADLGVDSDTLLLAAIGRLATEKGYGDLLEALDRLSDTAIQTHLLLIGDGPLRADLEAKAQRLGLRKRVHFLGFRSDVRQLLEAVDIVVFSSLWEGLPIALLEAMAARRCIVTTDVPGILEAVRDNREALVTPRGNAEALAAALTRVAEDPDLRDHLAEGARERFNKHFTAETMVRRYEALYHRVLQRA